MTESRPFRMQSGRQLDLWPRMKDFPDTFRRVSVYCFPLRTDPRRLERFCTEYLNDASEIAYFRPALPFVFLMVINYGEISEEQSMYGWAPHELVFTVPLEWYDCHGSRRIFRRWAVATPYTLVDNDLSAIRGREHLGYPEVPIQFETVRGPLMQRPLAHQRLLTVRGDISSRAENRVLLTIERDLPLGSPDFPLASSTLLNPFLTIPGLFRESAATVADLANTLRILVRRPLPLSTKGLWRYWTRCLNPFSVLRYDAIGLVQYPYAEDPECARFQELTHCPLRLGRIHGGGFLGSSGRSLVDRAVGFQIQLYQYPDYPICETLGLRTEGTFEEDGVVAQRLKPIYASWIELDLTFGPPREIAWRAGRAPWSNQESGEAIQQPPKQARKVPLNAALYPNLPHYQPVLEGLDVVISCLPVRVHADRLSRVVSDLFRGLPPETEIEPVSCPAHRLAEGTACIPRAWVFLILETYRNEDKTAHQHGRRISFSIPLRVTSENRNTFYVTYSPYIFTDRHWVIAAERNRLGLPTWPAIFLETPGPWYRDKGRFTRSGILEMRFDHEVSPGFEPPTGPFLEHAMIEAQAPIDPLVERAVEQLPDRLANGTLAVRELVLKQLPDARTTGATRFESVFMFDRLIDKVRGAEFYANDLSVRIRKNPRLPIVEMLGLETANEGSRDGMETLVSPDRPFWVRCRLRQGRERDLRWRGRGRDPGGASSISFESSQQTTVKTLKEIFGAHESQDRRHPGH